MTAAATTDLAYPVHETTLDNGLHVIVSPDHLAPIVAINLWYHVGSRDEVLGRTGFAHLFEHLMFEGSANVAKGEHLAVVEANGGSCNATTSMDRTNYFETLPTGAYELGLWLEADRLGTLVDAVDVHTLDNQRDVVKEEKRQRNDNVPYGDAFEHIVELTFPADHPYGHTTIGSMADLDAATVEDVASFFARHYRTDNATLVLAGDIGVEEGLAAAARHFGDLPSRVGEPARPVDPLPALSGRPRLDLSADVPASAAYLTWRLPAVDAVDFDALQVALDILGSGQTSRLHRRLVHDAQIAQGAGSSALGLVRGTSLGFGYARAIPGVPAAALEEAVVCEVESFLTDGPTERELARFRVQLEREWLSELARVDDRADQINACAAMLGSPQRVNSRVAELTAITAEDVLRACRTHLSPDQCAVLTYTPRSVR